MKRSYIIIFALTLSTALITSCEKEATNVKYPEFEPKLVVAGYIAPENLKQYFSVMPNMKIYGDSRFYDPGNITATFSSDEREITLEPLYVKYPQYYNQVSVQDSTRNGFFFRTADFPIEQGKTYTLKVTSEKGVHAEASCTVPFKRDLHLEIDTVRIYQNMYDWSYLKGEFWMTDFPGENNYYAFFGKQKIYYPGGYYIFESPVIPENGNYFDDKGLDGTRFRITSAMLNDPISADSAFLVIYLLNTDKSYYDFHKSLDNYNSGEDPFTEPAPLYTNITGGLGIFAAYTVDSIILRLK